jgi:hypothetical protein
MYIGLHVKYPLFLSDCNETWNFSTYFSKNTQISNFMKNPSSGSRVFHADRQTEDMTKLIFASLSANAPKLALHSALCPLTPGLFAVRILLSVFSCYCIISWRYSLCITVFLLQCCRFPPISYKSSPSSSQFCRRCATYGFLPFHSNHTTTKTHPRNNIPADRQNGLVTLKNFGLPDDGFD